ncbi:hypothetical protein HAX54_022605 [Datura stramonium]|uniref:Uncharacterized protein n=1 Tax=Datura stramonium TaxID=4076 RepID=A0ABS8S4T7_DATST|nr:hypothetical protein [Datura stramonium]
MTQWDVQCLHELEQGIDVVMVKTVTCKMLRYVDMSRCTEGCGLALASYRFSLSDDDNVLEKAFEISVRLFSNISALEILSYSSYINRKGRLQYPED